MQRLRVVTFNIAHGRGLTPIQGLTSQRKLRVNLRRIAALLRELDPDVVAMQEIDQRSRWSGNFDHLDYLRVHAGFPYAAFGIVNRREGLLNLSYGNALLSRHPLVETETVAFGRRRVGEKGFLYAEILAGRRSIPFVNVHLHFSSRLRRMDQLGTLIAWLRLKQRSRTKAWAMPPILCGDFNNPSHRNDATAALERHLQGYSRYTLHPRGEATFPSPLPRRMLDFVFLPSACRGVSCEVVRTFLSDHRPVMVDFTIG
jgi:endonuclease/exonuclease/phosphatase family metal-dependent hydrolase